jgi:hypothetical protein
MTQTFSYEFSTSGTPEEAQARLQGVLTDRLRRPSGGAGVHNHHSAMRLSTQTETSLTYKPKLVVPLLAGTTVWLGRVLRAEQLTVTFAPNGGEGGTRITVSGKVGRAGAAIGDREFWSEALRANNQRAPIPGSGKPL